MHKYLKRLIADTKIYVGYDIRHHSQFRWCAIKLNEIKENKENDMCIKIWKMLLITRMVKTKCKKAYVAPLFCNKTHPVL